MHSTSIVNFVREVGAIDNATYRQLDSSITHARGGEREFPQPSPLLCRGHESDTDNDCQPCEPDAPDKGQQRRQRTAQGGGRGGISLCSPRPQVRSLQTEKRVGGPVAEVSRARRVLPHKGKTQRHERSQGRIHQELH